MIHTIVSLADVFSQDKMCSSVYESFGSGTAEYIRYNGEKRLNRLFSTVPSDYLKILK